MENGLVRAKDKIRGLQRISRMARIYGMHKALANRVIETMEYTSMESMVRARSQRS
jgi:hypothetical protein